MKKLLALLMFCAAPVLAQTLTIDGSTLDPAKPHTVIYTQAPPVIPPPPVSVVLPIHLGISTTTPNLDASPLSTLDRICCGPVRWSDMEPTRGHFNFAGIDAWTAQSTRNVSRPLYTFLSTPGWAAASNTMAPRDVDSGDASYKEFVTALMQHECGVTAQPTKPLTAQCNIRLYETWNEFNVQGFWTDSYQHLAVMSNDAARIIRLYCSDCLVIGGSASAGGDGWNNAGGPGEFDLALLDFLTRWKALPSPSLPDAVSYHAYPSRTSVLPAPFPTTIVSHSSPLCATSTPSVSCRSAIKDQPAMLRATLKGILIADFPLWNTEGGYGFNTAVVGGNAAETATLRRAYLSQWMIVLAAAGNAENLAYAWDEQCWMTFMGAKSNANCPRDIVIPIGPTPIAGAWMETASWLTMTTLTGPLVSTPVGKELVWTIDIQHNGLAARLAWYTGWLTTTPYPMPAGFSSVQTLNGAVSSPKALSLGQEPVLLF